MPAPHTCAVSAAPCAACAAQEASDARDGIVRVPEHRCLNCGARLNAIGVHGQGLPAEMPEPGDPVACMRCGAVATWEDGEIRGFTDAEMDALIADTERMDELARLVKGIHFLRGAQN